MTSPLENLCGPGKPLAAEPADENEIAGLLRSGQTRLADARNLALSPESRFDLACNAAHALCLAALRRHRYRAPYRCIVFQALPHMLGLGPEVWRGWPRPTATQPRRIRGPTWSWRVRRWRRCWPISEKARPHARRRTINLSH